MKPTITVLIVLLSILLTGPSVVGQGPGWGTVGDWTYMSSEKTIFASDSPYFYAYSPWVPTVEAGGRNVNVRLQLLNFSLTVEFSDKPHFLIEPWKKSNIPSLDAYHLDRTVATYHCGDTIVVDTAAVSYNVVMTIHSRTITDLLNTSDTCTITFNWCDGTSSDVIIPVTGASEVMAKRAKAFPPDPCE